jgi:DNA polymerase-3 subunit chi
MVVNASFYHLMFSVPEKVIPKLVEKIYKSDFRSVIICDDSELLQKIDASLWTYSTLAFLPHGCYLDPADDPKESPIWLTSKLENPNQATVCLLCLTDSSNVPDISGFDRVLYVFDATSPDLERQYQERLKMHQLNQHNVSSWMQTKTGWTENPLEKLLEKSQVAA